MVILATCLAIVTGVILGILTAIRQYSGFDYAITMMAFVFFSLPVFWFAVLLKQYAAIEFNNWIEKAQCRGGGSTSRAALLSCPCHEPAGPTAPRAVAAVEFRNTVNENAAG